MRFRGSILQALARAAFHVGTLAGVIFALSGCVESARLLVPPQAYLFPAQILTATPSDDSSSKPMNLVRTGQHYVLVSTDSGSKNLIVDMMDVGDGYVLLQVWSGDAKDGALYAMVKPDLAKGTMQMYQDPSKDALPAPQTPCSNSQANDSCIDRLAPYIAAIKQAAAAGTAPFTTLSFSAIDPQSLTDKAVALLAKAFYCQSQGNFETQNGNTAVSEIGWVRSSSDAGSLLLKFGSRTLYDGSAALQNGASAKSFLGSFRDLLGTINVRFSDLDPVEQTDSTVTLVCKRGKRCIDVHMDSEKYCWLFLGGASPCVQYQDGSKIGGDHVAYTPQPSGPVANYEIDDLCPGEIKNTVLALNTLSAMASK